METGMMTRDGETAAPVAFVPADMLKMIEATKGANSYHLISDGGIHSYRTRIRTPSFPHIQMLPAISRGLMVPDLLVVIGSIDFVLADIDR